MLRLEEAKKYDHRLLGTKQELFFCHPLRYPVCFPLRLSDDLNLHDLLFYFYILSFWFQFSVQEVGSSCHLEQGFTTN